MKPGTVVITELFAWPSSFSWALQPDPFGSLTLGTGGRVPQPTAPDFISHHVCKMSRFVHLSRAQGPEHKDQEGARFWSQT